jgi:DNA-binding protein HU-beta
MSKNSVSKSDLIDAVAENTGLSKKAATDAINASFAIMKERVNEGGRVVIAGFGSFERKMRQARKGTHPVTGAVLEIPAKAYVRFKESSSLLE